MAQWAFCEYGVPTSHPEFDQVKDVVLAIRECGYKTRTGYFDWDKSFVVVALKKKKTLGFVFVHDDIGRRLVEEKGHTPIMLPLPEGGVSEIIDRLKMVLT